jgi:two-component system chemotaxis response regulator CheB
MENKENIDATCPDCRGPLSEIKDDGRHEFRCRVGHVYSTRSLLHAHSETQEKALWSAVVALEEASTLVQAAAPNLPPEAAARLQGQAEVKMQQAKEIRSILERLEPFQTD